MNDLISKAEAYLWITLIMLIVVSGTAVVYEQYRADGYEYRYKAMKYQYHRDVYKYRFELAVYQLSELR